MSDKEHKLVWRYGKYMPTGRVYLCNTSLLVDEEFPSEECLYGFSSERIVECHPICTLTYEPLCVIDSDSGLVLEGYSHITVSIDTCAKILVPTQVLRPSTEVYVPSHYNGGVDYVVTKGNMLNLLPELRKLCNDEEYQQRLAIVVSELYWKLPPSMQNKEEAILKACELAATTEPFF